MIFVDQTKASDTVHKNMFWRLLAKSACLLTFNALFTFIPLHLIQARVSVNGNYSGFFYATVGINYDHVFAPVATNLHIVVQTKSGSR